MPDSLRYHHAHRPQGVFGDSLAERAAEKVADGLGSPVFVIVSTLLICAWVTVNTLTLLHAIRFDPYPFILLNLAFSAQAFYTGALVIIAQKAQSKRDKASEAADATHREELSAMQRQLLDAIHDKVREDTPGGVQAILARLDELFPPPCGSDDK